MQTRSKTREIQMTLETSSQIDFDEASSAWLANKKKLGNGMYSYVCEYIHKTGSKCNNTCLSDSPYCKKHTRVTIHKNNNII